MAELNIKIKPDDVVERVIDEVAYKGKTIREWADLLTNPKSNADRIRAMSDEELADFIGGIYTLERDAWGDYDPCVVVEQSVKIRDKEDMLDWLRSLVGDDENGS